MDLASLAESGATAIISAVATDAWSWARTEVARLFARNDREREQEEIARFDSFAGELGTAAERDVHNRLRGYLEARLADDVSVRNDFFTMVRRLCIEAGLEPPSQSTIQHVHASNSFVVQTSGGPAHVQIVSPPAPIIRWAAMTGAEAARKLEGMTLPDAVEALTDMEPALAARRLSYVAAGWSQELLSHMDEGIAADLLSRMTASGQAAALLASMEPSQAAAILDMTVADWTVARLAEMDPDRALVLLAAMGSKRTENLLAAMERQQTVRLLSAVSKVLTDQVRVRTTLDLAQQKAEQIAAEARAKAQEMIDKAVAEANAIKAASRQEIDAARTDVNDRMESNRGQYRSPNVPRPEPARDTVAALPEERPTATVASQRLVATSPEVTLHPPHQARPSAFLLPTEYFLIAHDVQGHSRIDPATLETGIVGAVLCELANANLLASTGGELASAASSCGDPMGDYILAKLAHEPSSVTTLVREIRKDLFLRLAQRLADEGAVIPLTRGWPRSRVCYKPTSEATAYEPAVRLVRFLLDSTAQPDDRTYLLAALVDITQLHRVLPIDLRAREVRQLVRRLLEARSAPPVVDVVLKGIDAAASMLVVTPHAR
jgi:Golgi phosphoprotein 3 GPP34